MFEEVPTKTEGVMLPGHNILLVISIMGPFLLPWYQQFST